MLRNTPFYCATPTEPDEPESPADEAHELATETIRGMLLWIADAPTLIDRGLRATVALKCLRPDLIKSATLAKIGEEAARTRQHVHHLAQDFNVLMGHRSARIS